MFFICLPLFFRPNFFFLENALAKARAEKAAVTAKIDHLSGAPLQAAKARLAAAGLAAPAAAAEEAVLSATLAEKQAQIDELRNAASELTKRRADAGRALREEAEAHAREMERAVKPAVVAATRTCGGGFLSVE